MEAKKLSTRKLLTWLDQNLLAILAGFLLVFIPLYPKLPLFDVIPGYIVRVRLEDFLIALAVSVWLVQIVRKKARWLHPLASWIGVYLGFGFLSTLSAIFITRTVPYEWLHIGKMYFHYFRYIEYFTLMFIFYSAVRTKLQGKLLVILLALVMIGISLYGYGQKYLYWPVYSTMNREFAKGWRLYLTEHARVPSTFGGHYDLAAFTMIMLTILLALFFLTSQKLLKLVFGVSFILAFWLLILTASRTSFIAYLVAVTILMGILLAIKNWKWALPRWFGVMFFSIAVMLSFGDLSERFTQLLGLNKIKEKYASLAFRAKVAEPENSVSVEEVEEITLVTTSSDTPPVPTKPGGEAQPKKLPPDAYEDIPLPVATESGDWVAVSRSYSENAYKYGLSAAIRFDALWPRAIAGFKRNPLFGSGYSTLTKEAVGVFTEAESTDNNFLRVLGETGLAGFITFFGMIVAFMVLIIKKLKLLRREPIFSAFALGMVAASIGLLFNAFYIDVFAASKVAEMYWALVGLTLGIMYVSRTKSAPQAKS